jgi:hypothetical protein
MKLLKTSIFILTIGLSFSINAQDSDFEDKKSYYEKRALEDAKYEQEFNAVNENEEEAFWEEQKDYEKDLKKRDRKAYRAYIKGKRDAYAEHYDHCDSHCHHGHHYYHHASFYYYRYDGYYYNRYPSRRSTISSRFRLNTPNVSLGL